MYAETVDLNISKKTEKIWSSSIHKQGTNKRRSRDRKRIFIEKNRIYRSRAKEERLRCKGWQALRKRWKPMDSDIA